MSQYENHYNYKCEPMVCGNSIDISLNDCSGTQVRADITVEEYDIVNLWGQIKSCKGYRVSGALVKLVRVIHTCKGEEYVGIAHTLSDSQGFYQFELKKTEQNATYRIIVNRAEDYEGAGKCNHPHAHVEPCRDCAQCTQCSQCKDATHCSDFNHYSDCNQHEYYPCQQQPVHFCHDCGGGDTLCKNVTKHTTYDYSCKMNRR